MAAAPALPEWARGWDADLSGGAEGDEAGAADDARLPAFEVEDVKPKCPLFTLDELKLLKFALKAPEWRPTGSVWFKASLPPGVTHCIFFIELVPFYMLYGREMEFIFFKLALGSSYANAELAVPRESTDTVGSLHFNLKCESGGDKRDGNLHVLVHRLLGFSFLPMPSQGAPMWSKEWDIHHKNDDHRCNLLRNLEIISHVQHMKISGRKRKA